MAEVIWSIKRMIRELNNMTPMTRMIAFGHMIMNRISLGARPLRPGTDATLASVSPFGFMIDGIPYWFPGCDDAVEMGAAAVLTTASQYRKLLLSVSADAHQEQYPDGVLGGVYTIAGAAAATLALTGHVRYRLNGVVRECDLAATVALHGTDVLATTTWRAWRVLIDGLGAVTTQTVGDIDSTAEEDALLTLASTAQTANTVCIGIWTVNADGNFTPGTDNTDGETAENTFYQRAPKAEETYLIGTPATDVVAGAGLATLAVPAIDHFRLGERVAAIAVDTTVDMDDADIISTLKYGGWILCTDAAGTGYYTVSADGLPDNVSTMAYASQAALDVAFTAALLALPNMFVPIATVGVYNGTAGNFTAGTTLWDVALGVTTVTMLRAPSYHMSVTPGLVSTVDQASALLPQCPDDEVPIGYIELPVSFTARTTSITAAMCKPMRLQDWARMFSGVA